MAKFEFRIANEKNDDDVYSVISLNVTFEKASKQNTQIFLKKLENFTKYSREIWNTSLDAIMNELSNENKLEKFLGGGSGLINVIEYFEVDEENKEILTGFLKEKFFTEISK